MRLSVERLGHLGDGVAAGPVFVPGALPGEVVEGDVLGDRMVNPRIIQPSPDRVSAPCPHYKACGGCSLMHARPSFVADWKQDVVRQSLDDLAGGAVFRPIHTSPERSRRRATLAGRRTKTGAIVGLHGRGSGTILETPDCRLLHPALLAVSGALRGMVVAGASRKAELDLALTLTDAGIALAATGGKPLDPALVAVISATAIDANMAQVTWNSEPVVMARPPVIRLGSADVVLGPGAFLQATADGEQALVAAVQNAVGPAGRVADLFAGCGTFTLPMAACAEVHAVEADAEVLAALDRGWRNRTGLRRVTTETRDLFRRPLLPDELRNFDAVVIDPPRAGAEAQMRALAQSDVRIIAAVSCNPVTFARDARILVDAGFRIDWVQVVDQFRWSPHIEVVARFVR